jgi:hypothetical protein
MARPVGAGGKARSESLFLSEVKQKRKKCPLISLRSVKITGKKKSFLSEVLRQKKQDNKMKGNKNEILPMFKTGRSTRTFDGVGYECVRFGLEKRRSN